MSAEWQWLCKGRSRPVLQRGARWLLWGLSLGLCLTAQAEDMPTFNVEMHDGTFLPTANIKVPANQKIRLMITNTGTSAAEFESLSLRKEKVLGPGAHSSVVLHALEPGRYDFFDDFHPKAKGVIEAK